MRPIRNAPSREVVGLGLLFGAIYFVQGVGEPTEGLVAQPVRSLLKSWGRSDAQVTDFAAIVAIPWSLKPLFGLLTDAVPLFGSRRRSYLILTSAASAIGLLAAGVLPIGRGGEAALLCCLVVPTAAIAFADVVADALMIEAGRPRGITGTLQSVQWGCLWAATMAVGIVGGWLSENKVERLGFAICGGLSLLTLVLAVAFVREEPSSPRTGRAAWRTLVGAARTPGLQRVAAFLFLWNFNPFSQGVLHLHMTGALGLSQSFYGQTVTILAAACVAASIAYGFLARSVPMARMVRFSIVLGVVSTACYALLTENRASAIAITIAVGLTYMTATLIQLDLAARSCPPEAAGTAFALLMSIENLATTGSGWLGGRFYGWASDQWGQRPAFSALVALGAATTAACWLIVPKVEGGGIGDSPT